MKRILLAFAVAALTVASGYAVPAKRLKKTVVQPDGSTVTVTLTGDEWYHSYVTSDGLVVDFTPDGYVVYADAADDNSVFVHEVAERSAEELSFLASKSTSLNYAAKRNASAKVIARKAQKKSVKAPLRVSQGKVSIEQEESQVPHKGKANVPILLVNYKDYKFKDSDPNKVFTDFFLEGDKSAKKYFTDASNGQYDPEFYIYGPYNLSQNRKYYGGTDRYGTDERPGEMVKEAIQLADSEVDFSIFDNDGDGACDVVIVLYAGVGQASSGVTQSVWPCQWDLTSSGAGDFMVDGVMMSKFAVFNELNGEDYTKIDGVGTFCHEFSHCLGLPDFYDTDAGGHFGMGWWSLLDTGCYNDDGYTPIGYSAYEKAFMGWIELEAGQANTYYSLPVLNDPNSTEQKAVILTNRSDVNEYFIFENRAKTGWDKYIEDQGMLITHVTYSASAWANNTVNNYNLQRMTFVPADNKMSETSYSSDLWPKSYATEFTNTSKPAARTNTGSYLSQPVTEITRDVKTGVVSFWVDRAPIVEASTPELDEPIVNEAGSLIASWAPVVVEGSDVSYTLQVWPTNEPLPAPQVWTNTANNYSDWTFAGQYKTMTGMVYLGTTTGDGSMVSNNRVTPDNGAITIVANAKRYGTDSDPVLLFSLVDEDGVETDATEIAVEKTAEYYSAAITGLDNTKTYAVKIANSGRSKRVTLYSAMAFAGECADAQAADYEKVYNEAIASGSEAAQAQAVETVSGRRITVSGITDTSYTLTGLEKESYSYRVKAVPADHEKALDSFWSETIVVDLSFSGISDVAVDATSTCIISNGRIIATPGARLFSVSGIEISPVAPGCFAPAAGAYILVTPGLRPAKVVL